MSQAANPKKRPRPHDARDSGMTGRPAKIPKLPSLNQRASSNSLHARITALQNELQLAHAAFTEQDTAIRELTTEAKSNERRLAAQKTHIVKLNKRVQDLEHDLPSSSPQTATSNAKSTAPASSSPIQLLKTNLSRPIRTSQKPNLTEQTAQLTSTITCQAADLKAKDTAIADLALQLGRANRWIEVLERSRREKEEVCWDLKVQLERAQREMWRLKGGRSERER